MNILKYNEFLNEEWNPFKRKPTEGKLYKNIIKDPF